MIEMADPESKTVEILARLSGKPAASISAEMDLVGDLGIDSPKALEFLLDLEQALDIEIDDDDAARMETVGDVLAYVGQIG